MHHLVYRDELGSMRVFPLEARGVTIGRDRGRDVVLDDRQVSRLHATIEEVGDNFLLKDAGSVNGTFLNGLRLTGASAITLREGDVIEIAGQKICFTTDVSAAEALLVPRTASTGDSFQETVLPHADLLRDGLAWVREQSDAPDETSSGILAAFSGVPLGLAFKRSLDLLLQRVDADAAVAFLSRQTGRLELVASRPTDSDGRALLQTLGPTRLDERARLLHRLDERLRENVSDTCHGPRIYSAAAVPFFQGSTFLGVLAVERTTGARLDRKHAALVAVFGDRIARSLSIRGANPNDTPVGVAGRLG
jgi:hypothetical protein